MARIRVCSRNAKNLSVSSAPNFSQTASTPDRLKIRFSSRIQDSSSQYGIKTLGFCILRGSLSSGSGLYRKFSTLPLPFPTVGYSFSNVPVKLCIAPKLLSLRPIFKAPCASTSPIASGANAPKISFSSYIISKSPFRSSKRCAPGFEKSNPRPLPIQDTATLFATLPSVTARALITPRDAACATASIIRLAWTASIIPPSLFCGIL